MVSFSETNPAAYTIYFLAVTLPAMFSGNPIISLISLVCALSYSLTLGGGRKRYGYYIVFFIVYTLINPIVSHNGKTVLFLANNTPITLEALMYGVYAAVMIISVLLWFSSYSRVMTSDRLCYLLGRVSPRLSLLISMTIRFVHIFGARRREVKSAALAEGYFLDGNIIDTIRCELHIMSVLATWSLENGIRTADSMEARGYGVGRRTSAKSFGFGAFDIALIVFSVCLSLPAIYLCAVGGVSFDFYPEIKPPTSTHTLIIAYALYALLAMTPTICEIIWRLKWRYLRSRV